MNLEDMEKIALSEVEQQDIAVTGARVAKLQQRAAKRCHQLMHDLEGRLRKSHHTATTDKLILPQGPWLYLMDPPKAKTGLVAVNGKAL